MSDMDRKPQKFLFVLTSQETLGDTGEKTGFHFSEMAEPYYILEDHGVDVVLASINGGQPPADPSSVEKPGGKKDIVERFHADDDAMERLASTQPVDQIDIAEFEGVYLPGGHGTMWDFADNAALTALIEKAWRSGKIVAAVCHGPAGFLNVKDERGDPLVKNRYVNSFTDEEERKTGKDKTVPFLLESALREKGALFEHEAPQQAYMAQEGRLITGQNPASASLVANAILRALGISSYKGASAQAPAIQPGQ